MTLVEAKQKMLSIIKRHNGEQLPEDFFRMHMGISHGTFQKVRQELYRSGLIDWMRNEFNKPVYRLRTPEEQEKVPEIKVHRYHKPLTPMPDLQGVYRDFDDWTRVVDAKLQGGSIEDTDVANVYRVYNNDYTQSRCYYIYPFGTGVGAHALFGGNPK